jgi:hypothetical protein
MNGEMCSVGVTRHTSHIHGLMQQSIYKGTLTASSSLLLRRRISVCTGKVEEREVRGGGRFVKTMGVFGCKLMFVEGAGGGCLEPLQHVKGFQIGLADGLQRWWQERGKKEKGGCRSDGVI